MRGTLGDVERCFPAYGCATLRLFVGFLCLALAGCGEGPRRPLHDFVEEFRLAELLQEVAVVDVGSPEARRHLASGWYDDEGGGAGPSFAWSEGDSSVIEFSVLEVGPMDAELRCRPFLAPEMGDQVVTPFLNNHELPKISLGSGFASYQVKFPEQFLKEGRNRLRLQYRYSASPRELGQTSDWRRMAVAVDWLRFENGDNPPPPTITEGDSTLDLPAGSAVVYHVRHRGGLRFEADSVSAIGGGEGKIRCVAVSQSGGASVVFDMAAGEGPVSADVTGPDGEPFRLELRSVRRSGAESAWPVVRLTNPRLTAPAEPEDGFARRTSAQKSLVPQPPNVVIYLVDALRADRLGVYGQGRNLSPHLDAFAARATVYERAWAQSSWTRPSVASLFTGLRPEVHGANGRLDRMGDQAVTLAERFAGAGFATAAVVANPNISAEFGFAQGFESFVLLGLDERRSSRIGLEVNRWLDERDPTRPFFLYVHTVDPHLPYDPPEPYRSRIAPDVERADLGSTAVVGALQARNLVNEDQYAPDLLSLYDAEVACNDHSFGLLLDRLEQNGVADNTVVVFLSDHGEEFFEHGGWIHGRTLYREVLQVPLVIRWPNQTEGRRIQTPVQHADLMPTLLELGRLDPQPGVHGLSLVGPAAASRGIAAFLDLDGRGGWSVANERSHAIRHVDRGYVGTVELYDLEVDPCEHRNLGRDRGVEAGTLLDESRREVLGDEGRYEAGEVEIDDELRRRLEALGYL